MRRASGRALPGLEFKPYADRRGPARGMNVQAFKRELCE
jgi:hypothetical protein